MTLGEILKGVTVTKLFQTMYGTMAVTQDLEVAKLEYNSQNVGVGDCFVAIRGSARDGHAFIGDAIEKGAKIAVLEDDARISDAFFMHTGVVKVVVPDSRKALALMAANFYGNPARKMSLAAVTGTNGKTTTSHIIKSILESAGRKVGLVGTIEYSFGGRNLPASHTTPESLELHRMFAAMVEAHCTSVSMEVSSHALQQSRVYGLDFDVAVFTNLTQDHLDYHGTMEKYFEAKKILFDSLPSTSVAAVNIDDPWSRRIVSSTRASVLLYGFSSAATVRAANVELSIDGTSFEVLDGQTRTEIHSPLVGRFNVYNTLAAFAAGTGLGLKKESIAHGIESLRPVPGRFERIASNKGWTAIVDYAHTPDALENCLRTIREVLPSDRRHRIITVFGAGGDRDRTKRPIMGKIVSEWSDVAIVTSDNPRTEDPERIIREIAAGMAHRPSTMMRTDRAEAIQQALTMAEPGDVVLIAGKGHEDYQVVGKEKIHFSDRETVERYL